MIESLNFLFIPFAVASLCALLTGVLGCAVLWRKMAYLGDTIAHGALLGVAFSLLFKLPSELGIAASALAIAALFSWSEMKGRIPADAMLGIISHGSLALAIVAISLCGISVDVNAFLFGDILTAGKSDLTVIAALVAIVYAVAFFKWNTIMKILINEDIASVEGINIARYRAGITVALALTVAFSIKVTGVLLITALLIISAAAAKIFAKNPVQMVFVSCLLSFCSVASGFVSSFELNTPLGPSIVVCALCIFIACSLAKSKP